MKKLKLLAKIVVAIVLANIAFADNEADYIRHFDILLPGGSRLIEGEEHRFISSRSYDDTVREFYYRFNRSLDIEQVGAEINLPHVRSRSYRNLNPEAEFSAINIYADARRGLTEIFFVTRDRQGQGE